MLQLEEPVTLKGEAAVTCGEGKNADRTERTYFLLFALRFWQENQPHTTLLEDAPGLGCGQAHTSPFFPSVLGLLFVCFFNVHTSNLNGEEKPKTCAIMPFFGKQKKD